MIRLLARLLAAVLFPKEPERTYFFRLVQTNWHHTDSGPAEPKQRQQAVVVLPARFLQSSTACGGKVFQQMGTCVHFSGVIKM